MGNPRIDEILANQKDYYKVLGVSRDADEKEICRGYRTLALCLHPDKNLGDEKAGEAFCVAGRAYFVLKDPRLREIYDEGGVDAIAKKECMDDAPVSVFIAIIAKALIARLLYAVAREGHAVETLRERHQWVEQFVAWTPEDDFAHYWRALRAQSRRFVLKLFLRFMLLVLCIAVGSVILGSSRGNVSEEVGWDLYDRLSRDDTDDAGTSFLVCSSREGDVANVTAWRPLKVREEDAREVVQKWMNEFCPMELLLSWASRQRYEPTATLRAAPSWKRVATFNRSNAARHRRKSKFVESFSVNFSEALYVAAPFCTCYG